MKSTVRPLWTNTDDRMSTRQMVKGYLLKRHIPPTVVDQIIVLLASDAMAEGTAAQYDRFFAAVALSCSRNFNYSDQEIVRFLRGIDDVLMQVKNGECSWTDVMQQCRDETGFVMQMDDKNRLMMEYIGNDVNSGVDVTREVGSNE